MVIYEEEAILPAPRDAVLRLVAAHLDDATVPRIHHLILSQSTIERSGDETIVDRTIDVRGRPRSSRWRLIYRPPELFRWEIVEGEGPWTKDDYLENRYSDAPEGTRITSRGNLRIAVLPFFLSQKSWIHRVMGEIHDEDVAYLRAPR